MGIISRFKNIMSANINALLDKCEDPAKMIDQYLRDLESDLGKVKAETAAIMAEETKSKRELDECLAEIKKFEGYAEKAVLAGNDNDAREFLTKKAELTKELASREQANTLATANATKMKQMHEKLTKDIEELNARKSTIKAKVAVAKTQDRINKMGSSIDGVKGTMSAFDRMEEKADRMLDESNAMAELNAAGIDTSLDEIAAKYESASSVDVDNELAALKAKLGQ